MRYSRGTIINVIDINIVNSKISGTIEVQSSFVVLKIVEERDNGTLFIVRTERCKADVL